MATKIDISSLDDATKNKIEQLSKRCDELIDGVQRSTTLQVDYRVIWDDGERVGIEDIGPDIPGIPFKIHWDHMDKLMEDFKKEIDQEIKEIIEFSDSVADQLGVDRYDFFAQYFI